MHLSNFLEYYNRNLRKNIEIISSGFDRIPNTFKEIDEKQREEVEKLLEKIENDDDVQNVFHTMKY